MAEGAPYPVNSARHPARTRRSPEGDSGAVPGAAWSQEQPSLPRAQRIRSRNGTPGEETGLSPGAQAPLHPGFGVHAPGSSFTLGTQPPSIPRRGAAQRSASRAYAAPGEETRGRPGRSLPSRAAAAPPDRARGSTGPARAARPARPHHLPGGAYINAAAALPSAARQRGRAVVSARGVRAPTSPKTPPPCRPRQRASPQPRAAQLRAAQRRGSDSESVGLRSGAGGCGALAVAWRGPERAPERAPERGQTGRRLSRRLSLRPPPPASAPPSHRPRRRRAHAGERRHDAGGRAHVCRGEHCRWYAEDRGDAVLGWGWAPGTRVGREKRETRRGPHLETPALKHEALDQASGSTQSLRWRARRQRDVKVHPACEGSGRDELGGGGGGVKAPGAPWVRAEASPAEPDSSTMQLNEDFCGRHMQDRMVQKDLSGTKEKDLTCSGAGV
ncbi:unnamed protein product [Rangifer tarandus platyrhynchus]|uniref:Uncharacterized protein n=2 Tax=Rangifer tarandus platyrhynchus TaxID=3082113 RepID=A0ACB0FBJ0_RANTA|nr:unnamed protein product [Rangifer tarandus platyrhynchus]CAI9709401.1 unnamed protein product [Rangifer tarandus platyrhynchus]